MELLQDELELAASVLHVCARFLVRWWARRRAVLELLPSCREYEEQEDRSKICAARKGGFGERDMVRACMEASHVGCIVLPPCSAEK